MSYFCVLYEDIMLAPQFTIKYATVKIKFKLCTVSSPSTRYASLRQIKFKIENLQMLNIKQQIYLVL